MISAVRSVEKAHIYRYNRCVMEKLLSQLLPSFAHKALAADGISPVENVDIMNIPITNLAFDSRDVKEGALFFALPGTHRNGNDFISQALESSRAVQSKAPSAKRNDIFRPFCT